jgi:hypothetical protein
MECACFSTDNDDYVTMLASNHRRAAKHHRCSECLGTIFPGQTYLEERYLYDGTVSTHKTCACCESVREHLFCQFTYNELWFNLRDFLYDWMHYDLDGAPWAKIAKLTPAARAHVLLMIEEIWRDAIDDEEDEDA